VICRGKTTRRLVSLPTGYPISHTPAAAGLFSAAPPFRRSGSRDTARPVVGGGPFPVTIPRIRRSAGTGRRKCSRGRPGIKTRGRREAACDWSHRQRGSDRGGPGGTRRRRGTWPPLWRLVSAGRRSEDGTIPERYPLCETPSANYRQRTAWNVRDADATLILTWGPPTGGTRFMVQTCRAQGKPSLVIDLTDAADQAAAFHAVREWITANLSRGILNVAGPRARMQPAVYDRAKAFLRTVFGGGEGRPALGARSSRRRDVGPEHAPVAGRRPTGRPDRLPSARRGRAPAGRGGRPPR
jgi:hypothetical protein